MRYLKLLVSDTSKDSLLLLSASGISFIFSFFLTVILSNFLNPAEFGLIITSLTFTQLITDCFGLGVGAAMLRFIPNSSATERLVIIKSSFLLRVITATIVAIFTYLFSSYIAEIIFKSSLITPYIQLSTIGILLMMIVFWGQVLFQSEHRFFLSALTWGLPNVFRFILISVIPFFGLFNALGAYLSMQVALIPVVFLIFTKSGVGFLGVKSKLVDYKKILQFGLPAGIGFAFAAIYTKLDQMFIFSLVGEEEAGVYGLAFRLSVLFLLLSASFTSAITPRFSAISNEKFIEYFKKVMWASGCLAVFAALTIPLAPLIFPLVFKAFTKSIISYQVLTIGMVLFILSSPIQTAILYHYKRNYFSLILSLLSIGLIWFLLNTLIPLYKSLGAAVSVCLIYGAQLLISLVYFFYLKVHERG